MNLRLPRPQFSLRTLVILVVIVAALASWHGSRYVRYKARLAARTQAAVQGLYFFTHAEGENLYGYPLLEEDEPTLTERYDEFCFGHEASQFPICVLSMYEAVEKEAYKENGFQQVIELHPEVTIVDVALHKHLTGGDKKFQRIAWSIGMQHDLNKSNQLAIAMAELTQFPNLRRYSAENPAVFGDSWVTALPKECGLIELHGKLAMSPSSFRLLLNKAPHLEEFEMDKNLIDQVRDAVDARYYISQDGSLFQLKAKP